MTPTKTRDYFPILLDLKEQPCLVIGGGRVAHRKVEALLQAGARVTVISPEITEELKEMAAAGIILLKQRHYREGDLAGYRLAFAATSQREVNEACRQEARRSGTFLNVVDVPDLCDFIMPAVHQQGDLLLMVCSQARSPMLSKRIRRELQEKYGPEYGVVSGVMGELRLRAFEDLPEIRQRTALFQYLIEEGPVDEALHLPAEEARVFLWESYRKYLKTMDPPPDAPDADAAR